MHVRSCRSKYSGLVSLRLVFMAFVVLAGWWWSSPSFHSGGVGNGIECPLPQQVNAGDEPLQTGLPAGMQPFILKKATLTPLAGFSVDALVLAREDYRMDAGALLSPTDLALGWKRMSEPVVLSKLKISQSTRWYFYSWNSEPPLPIPEMARSSANMHLIPSTDAVGKALAKIGRHDRVRVDGWLVEAQMPGGGVWRSSTTRDDTGASSCELVYVCSITRL
jgi:hypothetical protein